MGISARVRAKEFLSTMLENGPRSSQELWPQAGAAVERAATMRRAKKGTQNPLQKAQFEGRLLSFWLLPHQELPARAIPTESTEDDLEALFAPLREQFPAPTPIDDV